MDTERISKQITQMPSRAFGNKATGGKSLPAVPVLQQRSDELRVNTTQNGFEPLIQKKANNTGLPDNLKAGIENLSGYDMSDVSVHYNSSRPNTIQAHAYAQGTDIHIAPGQEKHLPHEAWHVVQQKQGRVQATMQMKSGVAVNDDQGLEREADVMGMKAFLTPSGIENRNTDPHVQSSVLSQKTGLSNTIQRVNIDVAGGTFKAISGRYNPIDEEDVNYRKIGARILLDFIPKDTLDADSVSLVQTVNDQVKVSGEIKPERSDASLESRSIKSGEGTGTAIDQVPFSGGKLVNLDPRYTETRMNENSPLTKKPAPFPPPPPSTGYSAHRRNDTFTPALLKDEPAITFHKTSIVTGGMSFEVAALAEGRTSNRFVGSVSWGWEMKDGTLTTKPLSIVNEGSASLTFIKAADAWNEAVYEDKDGIDHKTMQLPLSKFYLALKAMPVNDKRKLLTDKIDYATNMQKMLKQKISTSFGTQKENLEKALTSWIRMKKSDEVELVEILVQLEDLTDQRNKAQF